MSVVRLERDEAGLAVATFDSPPLNLFDRAMFEGLRAAVDAVEAEPPRALLFRAEGRRYREGGVPAADNAVRKDAGELFATEDLQHAVETFLAQGPGHAKFQGR